METAENSRKPVFRVSVVGRRAFLQRSHTVYRLYFLHLPYKKDRISIPGPFIFSDDLLTPQPYINMSSETYSIPAHLCVCTLNCQCTGASGRLFKIPIWRMVS